jgi:DNA-binding response OmpR family regulator
LIVAQVLVIDDDTDIAALVGLKLGLDGHDVVAESDGLKGLARAQTDCPDIVIVDWTLPGLSGPDICARMREDPALDSTWVIMLTARPINENGAEHIHADEVISKPFSPRVLSERVTAALDR